MNSVTWMRKRRLVIGALTSASLALIAYGLVHMHHSTSYNEQSISFALESEDTPKVDTQSWQPLLVKSHDSIQKLLLEQGLTGTAIKAILHSSLAKHSLKRLKSGEQVMVKYDEKHDLSELQYPISIEKNLLIQKVGADYRAHIETKPLESTLVFKAAPMPRSPSSAAKAGLSPKMYQQLVKIFSPRVNLARALRSGDHFSILYRQYYVEGKKYRSGEIVAAELSRQGKTYRAIRFALAKNRADYFTPEGVGVGPAFLHQPLNYKRISSGFKRQRLDPYTHQTHPHLGVDYAANAGTPVKSISEGKIVFRGRKGGYGNVVIVQYTNKYKALYGHLGQFAHLSAGSAVHKGQTVGYVGSTGWATGPHLHFELYENGVPRNFLAMKLPNQSIPSPYLGKFRATARYLLAQLQAYQSLQLAENKKPQADDPDAS